MTASSAKLKKDYIFYTFNIVLNGRPGASELECAFRSGVVESSTDLENRQGTSLMLMKGCKF